MFENPPDQTPNHFGPVTYPFCDTKRVYLVPRRCARRALWVKHDANELAAHQPRAVRSGRRSEFRFEAVGVFGVSSSDRSAIGVLVRGGRSLRRRSKPSGWTSTIDFTARREARARALPVGSLALAPAQVAHPSQAEAIRRNQGASAAIQKRPSTRPVAAIAAESAPPRRAHNHRVRLPEGTVAYSGSFVEAL
jgi:hypothetical protein